MIPCRVHSCCRPRPLHSPTPVWCIIYIIVYSERLVHNVIRATKSNNDFRVALLLAYFAIGVCVPPIDLDDSKVFLGMLKGSCYSQRYSLLFDA